MNRVILGDCMEYMKLYPDNHFQLAVVDPPYGDECNLKGGSSSKGTNGWSGKLHKALSWNTEPTKEYFDELFRVSKNQICWGANHYIDLMPKRFSCFLIWDKGQRDFSLADGEMAWTSFKSSARFFSYSRSKANNEEKIHATQKPIALYDWIFQKYATKGMKILDTHGGSMSSVISAMKNEMEITCYEIDLDYFNAGKKRIETYLVQGDLFNKPQIIFNQ